MADWRRKRLLLKKILMRKSENLPWFFAVETLLRMLVEKNATSSVWESVRFHVEWEKLLSKFTGL